MLESNRQELFYIDLCENTEIMIKSSYDNGLINPMAHQFTAWMIDSLPNSLREISHRDDGFFGSGDFMCWKVTPAELVLIKLAWNIKTRDEWVADSHRRVKAVMDDIKNYLEVLTKGSLFQANENAWVEYLFTPEKPLCQITLMS